MAEYCDYTIKKQHHLVGVGGSGVIAHRIKIRTQKSRSSLISIKG